jgi:hypothetical protein
MLEDLLAAKGVLCLSGKDMQVTEDVKSIYTRALNGTPDLIIMGKAAKRDGLKLKPFYMVDVYSRTKVDAKAKFSKSLMAGFVPHLQILPMFHSGLVSGLTTLGGGILSSKEVAWFSEHYAIFQTEAQYWQSCLRPGRTLLNDKPLEETSLRPKPQYSAQQQKFSSIVLQQLTTVLNFAEGEVDILNDVVELQLELPAAS